MRTSARLCGTYSIETALIEEVLHDNHVHAHSFSRGGIVVSDLETAIDLSQRRWPLEEDNHDQVCTNTAPFRLTTYFVLDALLHVFEVRRCELGQCVQL
jgi:hypothetical protein